MNNMQTEMVDTNQQQRAKPPRVSVIIPTKNRSEDLRLTLEGLAIQSRKPDEIIIVDQSPIPSLRLSDFPIPITYIHDLRISGAATARNVAMDQASGEIWLFLDDDVILEPQYVEEIMLAYSPAV